MRFEVSGLFFASVERVGASELTSAFHPLRTSTEPLSSLVHHRSMNEVVDLTL